MKARVLGAKEQEILEVLKSVRTDGGMPDIVTSNMVEGVHVQENGHVLVTILVHPKDGPKLEPLRQRVEDAVLKLKDVHSVSAILTAEKVSEARANKNQKTSDPHGMEKNPRLKLPIKKIIAVASGKGGVGKSTVAAAIAHNLAKNGQLNIGLLDADIYGPSQPILMDLKDAKPEFSDDKKIIPPIANGVRVMSIGFMVDVSKALIWRGPMVQSAIYQLFRDVEWSVQNEKGENDDLDVLIVDMPPGTGDAQLTLAQKINVDGAIIVSTPQDLALADARKGVQMFRAVDVPILGLIENMSTHICSNCGHEDHIFGHGGAREEAEKLDIPFLGEIPLSADIRAKADQGEAIDLPEAALEQLLKTF